MRIKISGTSMWTTLVATFGAMVICSVISFFLAPTLYYIQMSQTETSPGSVGMPVQENTPIVSSIAEMQQYDRFTIRVPKHSVEKGKSARRKWNGGVYYTIKLDSGEQVALDIHFPSITQLPDNQTVLLPIGQWKEWKHPKDEREYYNLHDVKGDYRYYETFDYYVDMAGDIGHMPSKQVAREQIGSILLIPVTVLFIWRIRKWAVKKGLMEPEICKKKFRQEADKTIPQDDLERWFLASYAIYAKYCGTCTRIGCYAAVPKNKKMLMEMLKRDWGIKDRQDALKMYHLLIDVEAYAAADRKTKMAWDLVRANQLMGIFYLCDLVNRAEMRSYSTITSKKLRKYFTCWSDLCENYLKGYAEWCSRVNLDAQTLIEERQAVYRQLCSLPDGPYTINWRLPMELSMWENSDRCAQQMIERG